MEDNKGLISIIIPIYKVPENLLSNCIDSCMNQTYKNIEIILVDDGSLDNCGEICDNYSKKDNRIIVIHQENTGLSGARNAGVKKSTGEWVTFIDGDDYIDINYCEKLYNCTKIEDNIEVVCCSYTRKNEEKIIEKCYMNGIDEKLYKNEECKFLQEKVLDFYGHISQSVSKLIRKDFLIEKNLFHNEKLKQGAEDLEFTIRLFDVTTSVFVKNELLYFYVYNNKSITKKHNEKNQELQLKCFESIKEFIEKSSNKDRLLKLFYNRMAYIVITVAVSGYFSKSNKYESYKIKKKKYLKYLEQPLVQECLEKCEINKLDIKRKIIFWLIKHKMIRILSLLILLFR